MKEKDLYQLLQTEANRIAAAVSVSEQEIRREYATYKPNQRIDIQLKSVKRFHQRSFIRGGMYALEILKAERDRRRRETHNET